MTQLTAGFECAWKNGRDLLTEDRHVPEQNMIANYSALKQLGIHRVRDALPPGHDAMDRVKAAERVGVEVVWDLDHWWPKSHSYGELYDISQALLRMPQDKYPSVCFNEISWAEQQGGLNNQEAVLEAGYTLGVIETRMQRQVRLITAEPAHHPNEVWHHEALSSRAHTIGLNLYAHDLRVSIAEMLQATHEVYPVHRIAITETGLDETWQHRERPDLHDPEMSRPDWLRHVRREVEASGVEVDFVCWYPAIDGFTWTPGANHRNSSGLMDVNANVHPEMRKAIFEWTSKS